MTWRERAHAVIDSVITDHSGEPEPEIRRRLRAAYPFGLREGYPYQVWCEEVRRALRPDQPHRGRLQRRLTIDWNCKECGKVASLRVSQCTEPRELVAAIRTAHAEASPECPATPAWSYQGFYKGAKC